MITSKLTSKAQTTIPQPVRSALGLSPGDEIAYLIQDGRVSLTKAAPKPRQRGPFDDPFASFGEWNTPEDDEAFADLQAMDAVIPSTPAPAGPSPAKTPD